jgi:hypothetical protein
MKATWTLDDISHALERVKAALAEAREERPLLIVYIASHGISEGIAWNQFSLPGTFTYLGKPEELGIEPLSRATLHAATLVDKLEKLKIPFLVILDICYEGKSRSFESEALTATASRSSAAVAQILRHINEFNGRTLSCLRHRRATLCRWRPILTIPAPAMSDLLPAAPC